MNNTIKWIRRTYPLQWTIALIMLFFKWLTDYVVPGILPAMFFFSSFIFESVIYLVTQNKNQ